MADTLAADPDTPAECRGLGLMCDEQFDSDSQKQPNRFYALIGRAECTWTTALLAHAAHFEKAAQ